MWAHFLRTEYKGKTLPSVAKLMLLFYCIWAQISLLSLEKEAWKDFLQHPFHTWDFCLALIGLKELEVGWRKTRMGSKGLQQGLINFPASIGANSSMLLAVRGIIFLQDPAQAQWQDVLFIEGAVHRQVKMFLQQGRTLPNCSQDCRGSEIRHSYQLHFMAGGRAGVRVDHRNDRKAAILIYGNFFVLFHSVFTCEV